MPVSYTHLTDDAIMQQHGIEGIDMVVVNLYPFAATVAKPNCTLADAVENIDIGGPTMVRSAAKNHKDVAIVVNNHDFNAILAEMDKHQNSLTLETRFDLSLIHIYLDPLLQSVARLNRLHFPFVF